MNTALRNRLLAAAGGGAIAVATVLLGGQQGLEGREYTAYRDVVGVLTVCDGHTGPDIVPGKRYSDDECNILLQRDLHNVARQIDPHIKVPLSAAQHAALYSFAYNVGTKAFADSTLLKKLNAGDTAGACAELRRWVYAGSPKRQWQGLINRREVEHEVCTWSQR